MYMHTHRSIVMHVRSNSANALTWRFTMSQNTLVEAVRQLTNKELVALVLDLQDRVVALESKSTQPTSSKSEKEMTEDDARRILSGDLAHTKHKDAAATLGLTYGQIYSCRLEYTFKTVHKEMKEAGTVNPWKKA